MSPYREPGLPHRRHLCVDCGRPCLLPALLCERCIMYDAICRALDKQAAVVARAESWARRLWTVLLVALLVVG